MQSALSPAGIEAAEIARLSWWLFGGAACIWVAVLALAGFASAERAKRHGARYARGIIIGGGVVFPLVTLAALLAYGMRMTPALLASDSDFVVEVTGEQWWWRVRYLPAGAAPVSSANEIRLPLGRRVTFHLRAADVIHSFWIPVLGGKMDMIPGRTNVLTVEPTAAGVYRGVCAEFCGASHALMAFDVVVMQPAQFQEWLRRQAQDAVPPPTAQAERGQRLFLDQGCGACHRIGGTEARGLVGPDLTHVGSRLTIAAGTLPAEPEAFARWLMQPDVLKPEVEMPAFHMLAGGDLAAVAEYLSGLQ